MTAACRGVRRGDQLAGRGRALIPIASALVHEVAQYWRSSAGWNPGRSSCVFGHLLLVDHLLLEIVARSLLRRNERADQPKNRKEDAHNAQHRVPLTKGQDTNSEEAADVEHR